MLQDSFCILCTRVLVGSQNLLQQSVSFAEINPKFLNLSGRNRISRHLSLVAVWYLMGSAGFVIISFAAGGRGSTVTCTASPAQLKITFHQKGLKAGVTKCSGIASLQRAQG